MIQERKRSRNRKKITIGFLAAVILIALLAFGAIEGFRTKKVVVTGNELYTDAQIKASVLGDKYSWNSLYVYLKYKLFRMEEVPFIDVMEVTLKSPQILEIHVYEKAIIGYLESNNRNVYFDKEGFVVEISKKTIPDIPKVEGLECKKAIVYEKLNIDDEQMLSAILALSQQLQKYSLVPETIQCLPNQKLSAVFKEITVIIGDTENLVEKVMCLDGILPSLKEKSGTLHLENWTPMTKDIVFQPDKSSTKKKK